MALSEDISSSSLIPVTVAPSPAILIEVAATNAPVTSTVSAKVILDESDESKVVPFTLNELKTTSPVPEGVIFISSLDLVAVILLPKICSSANTTLPEPDGENTRSSFDLVADMLLPATLIPAIATPPDPCGINLISSFDLRAVILLSSIFIPAPNCMTPVPDASKLISALLNVDFISLPSKFM